MWSNNWNTVSKHGAGNQGTGYVVTRKGEDGTRYFLKELKNGGNSELRKRFFREVKSYQTFDHPRIPKLVMSNAEAYPDAQVPLYFVAEFIDGITLAAYVQKVGRVSTGDALTIMRQLLKTLAYAHERNVVHRDIKPDNIVLRGSSPTDPVLVDWGMAYMELPDQENLTENAQEIGNRFLRLPEHSSGSPDKREFASDITFSVGILFYLLSGEYPRQLSGADDRKPHESDDFRRMLSSRPEIDPLTLLPIFDQGFDHAISRRFQTAAELEMAMDQIAPRRSSTPSSAAETLRGIRSHLVSHKGKQTAETHQCLKDIGKILWRSAHSIELDEPNLACSFGGTKFLTPQAAVQVGAEVNPMGDDAHRFSVQFEGRIVGSDVIIGMTLPYRKSLLRFSRAELAASEGRIKQCVSETLLTGLYALLTGDGIIREKYFFGTVYDNLGDATAISQKDSRPIFLVIFDKGRPDKSNLDHLLGYFMQFESTKTEVNRSFVQAVVDVSQLPDRSLVPSDASLEECLWVVIGPNGKRLIAESVYGNPNEGAKRVRTAIAAIGRQ